MFSRLRPVALPSHVASSFVRPVTQRTMGPRHFTTSRTQVHVTRTQQPLQRVSSSCRLLSTSTSTSTSTDPGKDQKDTSKETKRPLPGLEDEGPPFEWRKWFTPSGVKANVLQNKPLLMAYAKIGGTCVLIYYVVKTGFNIADFFSSTSFYDVATVSFIAGGICAGVTAVIVSYASRMFTIRPELVYKQVLRRMQADHRVRDLLGAKLTPGKFRAYNLSGGGVQLLAEEGKTVGDYSGWERFWKPRKVQMMFQLEGDKDLGMVSFEAQKLLDGSYNFNSIVLDCMKNDERLCLEGSPNIEVYQGKIKLR